MAGLLAFLLLIGSIPTSFMNIATECLNWETEVREMTNYKWDYNVAAMETGIHRVGEAENVFDDGYLRIGLRPIWSGEESRQAEFEGLALGIDNMTTKTVHMIWGRSTVSFPDLQRPYGLILGSETQRIRDVEGASTKIPPETSIAVTVYPRSFSVGETYKLNHEQTAQIALRVEGLSVNEYTFDMEFYYSKDVSTHEEKTCTQERSLWEKTFGFDLPPILEWASYITAGFYAIILVGIIVTL